MNNNQLCQVSSISYPFCLFYNAHYPLPNTPQVTLHENSLLKYIEGIYLLYILKDIEGICL